jgi:DNA-binding transcriptional ArsR family regulator
MLDLPAYFGALSDRKRFRILVYLSEHEATTVTELGTKLRMSQPLISWHLRSLRKAGLVKTRRAGRQVWCSLNRPAIIRYEHKLFRALGIEEVSLSVDSTEPLESAARH